MVQHLDHQNKPQQTLGILHTSSRSDKFQILNRSTRADFDIGITTETLGVRTIIPNATTLENTTINVEYGDY